MALDYFTIDEVRDLRDIGDFDFTDADITSAGLWIQGIVERLCATTFVPREVVEIHDGTGGTSLLLRKRYVQSVDSVTVDGVELTDDFTFDDGVLERRLAGSFTCQTWSLGRRNIEVTYSQGYSATPPDDLRSAMLDATRYRLLATATNSAANARRTSLSTEMGVETWAVAGKDRPTGYPEVDAVLNDWAGRVNTVVFP